MFRNLINEQREYFNNDNTKRYSFRLEMLKRLKTKILENEEKIADALYKDLKLYDRNRYDFKRIKLSNKTFEKTYENN